MPSTTIQRKTTTARSHFTVPVFPHLKKFISKTYGTGMIRTEETTVLGRLVTAALRDNRINKGYKGLYGQYSPTAEIQLWLTKEQTELGPRLNKLIRLNLDMDRVFKEALTGWIIAQEDSGMMAYTACKAFLKFYNIDDSEYSLDAAYKHWQRYKKE